MHRKRYKSESSIGYILTYLTMYDWVVILGVIALASLYFLGFFDGFLATTECIPNSGFICQSASISTSGYLTAQIGQNGGHTIYISDFSCSNKQNVNNYPEYGNRYLVPGQDANGSTFINNIPIFVDNNSKYIKLPSDSLINITIPCFMSNSTPVMQAGQVFNGTLWMNYSYMPNSNYKLQKITSGLIQKAVQNTNFGFGYTSIYKNNATATSPLGYQNYICAIGISYGPIKNNNKINNILTSSYEGINDSEIYTQSSNSCSASGRNMIGYSNSSISIASIGIGQSNYTEYRYSTNKTYGSNFANIKYSVSENNSFVVIVAASGYYGLLHSAIVPYGCKEIITSKQIFDGIYAAICPGQRIGDYNATVYSGYNSSSENGAISIAAYVFRSS